jgi:hypothetical protein
MASSADDLYLLDPSEFTAARDRLAAELRKAGDSDGAAEVKALRRPTVTAWALNQLARRSGDEVRLLLAASTEVARAQAQASSGGDASTFRRLTKERRELVHRLAAAGVEVLDEREAGSGAGRRDALITALEAASMDEEGGEALLAGRLSTEPQPASGFGGFLTAAVTAAEGTAPSGPSRGEVRTARERAERRPRRRWRRSSASWRTPGPGRSGLGAGRRRPRRRPTRPSGRWPSWRADRSAGCATLPGWPSCRWS